MDPFLQIAPWRCSIWRPPIRGTFCRTAWDVVDSPKLRDRIPVADRRVVSTRPIFLVWVIAIRASVRNDNH
jgi:hypothetical protein